MSARASRRTQWVFTYNNPPAELIELFSSCDAKTLTSGEELPLFHDKMRWFICQLEVGTEGTEHYQGAFVLKVKERMSTIKVWFEEMVKARCPSVTRCQPHFEPMKGTVAQARHYCRKPVLNCNCKHCKDAEPRLQGWFEGGEIPKSGKGAMMQTMLAAAEKGLTLEEVGRDMPSAYSHGKAWALMVQTQKKRRANKWRDVTVEVLLGPAGSGKSRAAVDESGGYDKVYFLTKLSKSSVWFDGLDEEKVLIIDDFDDSWSIDYRAMLRLLDGHPLRLPVKGAFTYGLFDKIYVTCNVPVERWYPKEKDISALLRRINKIRHFPEASGSGSGTGGNTAPQSHFSSSSTTTSTTSTRPFIPLQRQNAFRSGRRAPRFGRRDEDMRQQLHGGSESARALVSLAGVGVVNSPHLTSRFEGLSISDSDEDEA